MAATPNSQSPFANDPQLEQQWKGRAELLAAHGLDNVSPERATKLLEDLLRHPANSRPRAPKREENTTWEEKAQMAYTQTVGRLAAFVSGGNGSSYPVLAGAARIQALVARGADPEAAGALFRAVCRESEEECEALLGLPNAPSAGSLSAGGSSCLHRAAYNGPTPVFNVVAARAKAEDWLSRDGDGRYPLGKALMAHNLKRALECAKNSPLALMEPDNKGNTLLIQIVEAFCGKRDVDLGQGKWRALFDQILAGSDPKAKNDKGETALDVATRRNSPHMGPVRAALEAQVLRAEVNLGRDAATAAAAPARRPRSL